MNYVVIRDMSAGNESVGETWQETKIFSSEDRLLDVMKWALGGTDNPSKKQVTLTITGVLNGSSFILKKALISI